MRRFIAANLFTLLLSVLCACSSTKDISGTYRSNFAELGFFGTTIRLRPDSTMQYVFQGDLIYDSAAGHYQVFGNKLYLNFDKELQDTTKLYNRFDSMPLKIAVYSSDTIQYKLVYDIGHKKLFSMHLETGKKVTTAMRYNKLRRYIFFGSHYYKKRHYLRRID